MTRLDRLISRVMRGQSRRLWRGTFWGGSSQTIIGYGDFTTRRAGGKTVDWFMVGLALQACHISIYVNAVEDGKYVAEIYGPSLGRVRIGKAAISFASIDDIDLRVLQRVIAVARRQLVAAQRTVMVDSAARPRPSRATMR